VALCPRCFRSSKGGRRGRASEQLLDTDGRHRYSMSTAKDLSWQQEVDALDLVGPHSGLQVRTMLLVLVLVLVLLLLLLLVLLLLLLLLLLVLLFLLLTLIAPSFCSAFVRSACRRR